MEITRIGPADWERFRDVRLASLSESPAAFGARHADWVSAPAERWQSRLTQVPLTLLAHEGTTVLAGQDRLTYLMVLSDNIRARKAYARAGFVDRGVPEGWPADEPPERRMELPA